LDWQATARKVPVVLPEQALARLVHQIGIDGFVVVTDALPRMAGR
jgi:hypothetical protein